MGFRAWNFSFEKKSFHSHLKNVNYNSVCQRVLKFWFIVWFSIKVTTLNSNFWWCTVQKIFYFFTCILLDYMANEITKEFWKSIHFENMTVGFLLSCHNWLRWEISLLCHWNIDSWKQKMSLGHVMVPKNYQNII